MRYLGHPAESQNLREPPSAGLQLEELALVVQSMDVRTHRQEWLVAQHNLFSMVLCPSYWLLFAPRQPRSRASLRTRAVYGTKKIDRSQQRGVGGFRLVSFDSCESCDL